MYHVNAAGWLSPARHIPSPNFNARPPAVAVDLIVLHGISLPAGRFGEPYIEELFTNCLDCSAHPDFQALRGLEVSSHLLVDRFGRLTQFVSLHQRAWHAGKSVFEGRENCNDFSIGIELEGTDHRPYTDAQYRELGRVVRSLLRSVPALSPHRIVGHSDVAPGRKTDPGPAFDWQRFRQQVDN